MLRTLFGPIWGPISIFFIFFTVMTVFILRSPDVQLHLPDFIALSAIAFAIFYSFLFLIAPEFSHERGLEGQGYKWLAGLLIIGFVVTSILISFYADRTFLAGTSPTCPASLKPYVERLLESIFRPFFPTTFIGTVINFLEYTHLLIFAIVFTAVDCLFMVCAPRGSDKRKFRLIFLVVDIPIIIAVTGTLLLKLTLTANGHGADAQTFESGAISFQLLSGSVAAYAIDHRILLIRNARRFIDESHHCLLNLAA